MRRVFRGKSDDKCAVGSLPGAEYRDFQYTLVTLTDHQLTALRVDVQLLAKRRKKPLRSMTCSNNQFAAAIGDLYWF